MSLVSVLGCGQPGKGRAGPQAGHVRGPTTPRLLAGNPWHLHSVGWRSPDVTLPVGAGPLVGAQGGGPRPHASPHRRVAPPRRAEPALTRIQEDRRRIVLPAIDNIKYDTFEVQQYASAAHGYNWGLWCMYIIPPQDWLDRGDEAAPIR